jgi:serine/threonine protein kinase
VSVDETAPDARASNPRLLEPGAQLGKYKLARLLGEGGMGQVWAAHDPDLDRDVALKLLRAENAAPQLRTLLLREARAMARLKHPNVLTVYEVGSEGDRDYIAMELVDGLNLDQWLATTPPRQDVWHALLAAGRGLAAAHRAGLVHRDFKPHNVLRSRDGRVLVTDFGLARGVGDEPVQPVPASLDTPIALDVTLDAQGKDSVLDSPLTQTGALIGTPAYMAPEQYTGSPPDPRTDQFAFCVTVWQALTGERPFQGQTLDELRRQTSRGVKDLKTKLPARVRGVLVRGLDPDPARRWDDLDDLIAALEKHTTKRRRAWWISASAMAIGTIVARLLVDAMHPKPQPPPPSPYACQAPEQAFADAWTSERRNALESRVGAAASLVSRALDDLRHGWLEAYAAACAAPPSQATFAKLGCLLGERDEVSAFARLAETLPTTTFDRLDPWGELPRVDACASQSPIAPPLLPDDHKQRDKIIALRAEIASLRLRDPQSLLDKAGDLARAAKALGWAPLEPELDQSIGEAAQWLGRYDAARAHLTAAAERAAQLRD